MLQLELLRRQFLKISCKEEAELKKKQNTESIMCVYRVHGQTEGIREVSLQLLQPTTGVQTWGLWALYWIQMKKTKVGVSQGGLFQTSFHTYYLLQRNANHSIGMKIFVEV